MTPVEALAAAMHKAWPRRTVGDGADGNAPIRLAAATILAALDGWTLVPESDLARLQVIEGAVEEAYAYLDDMGMSCLDDGEWVVPPAGCEKFKRAMNLLDRVVARR